LLRDRLQHFFASSRNTGPRAHAGIHKDDHPRWDWFSPLAILSLAIIGIFFIYSAQLNSPYSQWKMQVAWLLVGTGVYLTVSFVDYEILMRLGHWIWVISILLLGALWVVGVERYDARRWINFGFFSFQPSEVAKISVLIMVSSILARSEIGKIKESLIPLLKVAFVFGFPLILILLQPDLGTGLVLIPMVLGLLYISNLSGHFFVAMIVCGVVGLTWVTWDTYRYIDFLEENDYTPTSHLGAFESHSYLPYFKDYQRNRILGFIMPNKVDPLGIGWNSRQSRIAVGSGGVTGKGWTEGTQAKLGYVPRSVAHNDFIFSVIAEEKGFLGSFSVLGLSGVLLLNGIRIAGKARDRFGMLLAVGVSIIFLIHILVNIGMTIGLMPITGLPLPFVSYGGSFLISCCILQGIVQSVYRHRKDF